MPKLARLDFGPLKKRVELLAPDADGSTASPWTGIRKHEVGDQLAAVDETAHRHLPQPEYYGCGRNAQPLLVVGPAHLLDGSGQPSAADTSGSRRHVKVSAE